MCLYARGRRDRAGRSPGDARGRSSAQPGAAARPVCALSRARTVGDAGRKGSLLKRRGRSTMPALAKEEEIEIPVQVNGKLRSRITVPADATEEFVLDVPSPMKK